MRGNPKRGRLESVDRSLEVPPSAAPPKTSDPVNMAPLPHRHPPPLRHAPLERVAQGHHPPHRSQLLARPERQSRLHRRAARALRRSVEDPLQSSRYPRRYGALLGTHPENSQREWPGGPANNRASLEVEGSDLVALLNSSRVLPDGGLDVVARVLNAGIRATTANFLTVRRESRPDVARRGSNLWDVSVRRSTARRYAQLP